MQPRLIHTFYNTKTNTMDVEIRLSHVPAHLPPRESAILIFNALSEAVIDITQTQSDIDAYVETFSNRVINQIRQDQKLYPYRDDFPKIIAELEQFIENGKKSPPRKNFIARLFRL